MRLSRYVGLVLVCVLVLASTTMATAQAPGQPALVVFIAVDQLRGDYLPRHGHRLAGGLRYLLDHGAHFTNAHYRHAATVTAVGHATLATGANPPEHGLVENQWFDTTLRRMVYCVEDPEHQVLGMPTKADDGTSPKKLIGSTIGDELILATGGRSRVFGVSFKDRAAMLMAGHLGKAYWFHSDALRFLTSTYYHSAYPAWIDAYNDSKPAEQYREATWELLQPIATYTYGHQDDREVEKGVKFFDTTFPHDLRAIPAPFFGSGLRVTPFADALTLDFARALVENEELGQRGATDMLCISLTASDVIGHVFGPMSLEVEDNFLQLDKNLGDFFAYLDKKIGLRNILFALSADHGGHETMASYEAIGLETGRIDRAELQAAGNAHLKVRFNCTEDLILSLAPPHIYLDPAALENLGVALSDAENALAEFLRARPGIAYALTRGQLHEGRVPLDPAARRLARSWHPARGGSVLVAELPYWSFSSSTTGGTHNGPWKYDTAVPVLLAGPGVAAGVHTIEAGPEDIAPTLASLLGILPPSASVGNVLPVR